MKKFIIFSLLGLGVLVGIAILNGYGNSNDELSDQTIVSRYLEDEDISYDNVKVNNNEIDEDFIDVTVYKDGEIIKAVSISRSYYKHLYSKPYKRTILSWVSNDSSFFFAFFTWYLMETNNNSIFKEELLCIANF